MCVLTDANLSVVVRCVAVMLSDSFGLSDGADNVDDNYEYATRRGHVRNEVEKAYVNLAIAGVHLHLATQDVAKVTRDGLSLLVDNHMMDPMATKEAKLLCTNVIAGLKDVRDSVNRGTLEPEAVYIYEKVHRCGHLLFAVAWCLQNLDTSILAIRQSNCRTAAATIESPPVGATLAQTRARRQRAVLHVSTRTERRRSAESRPSSIGPRMEAAFRSEAECLGARVVLTPDYPDHLLPRRADVAVAREMLTHVPDALSLVRAVRYYARRLMETPSACVEDALWRLVGKDAEMQLGAKLIAFKESERLVRRIIEGAPLMASETESGDARRRQEREAKRFFYNAELQYAHVSWQTLGVDVLKKGPDSAYSFVKACCASIQNMAKDGDNDQRNTPYRVNDEIGEQGATQAFVEDGQQYVMFKQRTSGEKDYALPIFYLAPGAALLEAEVAQPNAERQTAFTTKAPEVSYHPFLKVVAKSAVWAGLLAGGRTLYESMPREGNTWPPRSSFSAADWKLPASLAGGSPTLNTPAPEATSRPAPKASWRGCVGDMVYVNIPQIGWCGPTPILGRTRKMYEVFDGEGAIVKCVAQDLRPLRTWHDNDADAAEGDDESELEDLKMSTEDILKKPAVFEAFFNLVYAVNRITLILSPAFGSEASVSCKWHNDQKNNVDSGPDVQCYLSLDARADRLFTDASWHSRFGAEARGALGERLTRRLLVDPTGTDNPETATAHAPLGLYHIDVSQKRHAVEGFYEPSAPQVSSIPARVKSGKVAIDEFFDVIVVSMVLRMDARTVESAMCKSAGSPVVDMALKRGLHKLNMLGKKEHTDSFARYGNGGTQSGQETRRSEVSALTEECITEQTAPEAAESTEKQRKQASTKRASARTTGVDGATEGEDLYSEAMKDKPECISPELWEKASAVFARRAIIELVVLRDWSAVARAVLDHEVAGTIRAHSIDDYPPALHQMFKSRSKTTNDALSRLSDQLEHILKALLAVNVPPPAAATGVEIACYSITQTAYQMLDPKYVFLLFGTPECVPHHSDLRPGGCIQLDKLLGDAVQHTRLLDVGALSFQCSTWQLEANSKTEDGRPLRTALFASRPGRHAHSAMGMLLTMEAMWHSAMRHEEASPGWRLADTAAADEWAMSLPQLGSMRAERLVGGMARMGVFGEQYTDVALTIEEEQGNFKLIREELPNDALREHSPSQVLAAGRYVLALTRRIVLEQMIADEKKREEDTHRLSLSRLGCRMRALYSVGDAVPWHDAAAIACEAHGLRDQLQGVTSRQKRYTLDQRAPPLNALRSKCSRHVNGSLQTSNVIVDISSDAAAERSTKMNDMVYDRMGKSACGKKRPYPM